MAINGTAVVRDALNGEEIDGPYGACLILIDNKRGAYGESFFQDRGDDQKNRAAVAIYLGRLGDMKADEQQLCNSCGFRQSGVIKGLCADCRKEKRDDSRAGV